MAVFSDSGAHCSLDSCRRLDFLPFTCEHCSASFCLDHFRCADHGCPNGEARDNRVLVCPLCRQAVPLIAGQDPHETWQRHEGGGECEARRRQVASSSAPGRCPAPGCREALSLSGSLTCPRCNLRVCLKHRFEDTHPCKPVPRSSPQISRSVVASACKQSVSVRQSARRVPTVPSAKAGKTRRPVGGSLQQVVVARGIPRPPGVQRLHTAAVDSRGSGSERFSQPGSDKVPSVESRKQAARCLAADGKGDGSVSSTTRNRGQRDGFGVTSCTVKSQSQTSRQHTERVGGIVSTKLAERDRVVAHTAKAAVATRTSDLGHCLMAASTHTPLQRIPCVDGESSHTNVGGNGCGGKSDSDQLWRCSACTLDNSGKNMKCDACGTERLCLQTPAAKRFRRDLRRGVVGACGSAATEGELVPSTRLVIDLCE
eukprot:TRINITY_DN50121_c0_g1_i1.p1 TRINITY_DN50121_c0_g1~~TRINITY_DN50121_c0_g1_i1.p1  ORF type:complete len:438 (+),score=59.08 TRINITY_DN50121_c0_g1_i1:33-1316(+)